jgi:hypothetical protein
MISVLACRGQRLQTEMLKKLNSWYRANRRMTADRTTDKLGISHGSVHTTVNKDLQFTTVCARRLPRELTTEHKKHLVEVCTRLLERYQKKSEAFFKRIVTRDQTWGQYWQRESKRQRKHRKHPSSPTTKFEAQSSTANSCLHRYTVSGIERAYTWTLPVERWNSEQWTVNATVPFWPTNWSRQSARSNVDGCGKP